MRTPVILVKLFCRFHQEEVWHILTAHDGYECLECRVASPLWKPVFNLNSPD